MLVSNLKLRNQYAFHQWNFTGSEHSGFVTLSKQEFCMSIPTSMTEHNRTAALAQPTVWIWRRVDLYDRPVIGNVYETCLENIPYLVPKKWDTSLLWLKRIISSYLLDKIWYGLFFKAPNTKCSLLHRNKLHLKSFKIQSYFNLCTVFIVFF